MGGICPARRLRAALLRFVSIARAPMLAVACLNRAARITPASNTHYMLSRFDCFLHLELRFVTMTTRIISNNTIQPTNLNLYTKHTSIQNTIQHHHRRLASPHPPRFFPPLALFPIVPDSHCRCVAPVAAPAGDMMGLKDSCRTTPPAPPAGVVSADAAPGAVAVPSPLPPRLASMSMKTRGLIKVDGGCNR